MRFALALGTAPHPGWAPPMMLAVDTQDEAMAEANSEGRGVHGRILAMVGHTWGFGAACLVVLCFGAACSSGGTSRGGGEACETITPCGGDPVGTWTLSSSCIIGGWEQLLGDMYDEPECSNALASVDVTPSGTLAVNADGTYETQTHMSMSMRLVFTRDCIGALAGLDAVDDASLQAFCDGAQSGFDEADEDTSIDSATCSVNAGACQCTTSYSEDFSDSGTYVISGTSITTTDADGEVSQMSFCIQGNQMQTEETSDGTTGVGMYQRS